MTPPSNGPSLSVIICCYTQQRWDDIVAGVAGVLGQLATGDELLVVVDHELDLLHRLRAHLAGSPVRVVENENAQGLSGARNTGVASATGQVVAFLDDDALPPPGWVECLRQPFEDTAITGVAGGVSPAWEGGSEPRWFPEEFGWVVGCDYRGMPADGQPVRNPIGASMALRRDVVHAAGGFSELVGRVGTLPVGCEETELSIRLRATDPSTVIVRATRVPVLHRVPASRQRWSYFYSRCYHEGRSKAVLSGLVGSEQALASERTYATRTLPLGVLRHLAALARGDLTGGLRAFAIVSGLLVTAGGYLAASRKSAPTQG